MKIILIIVCVSFIAMVFRNDELIRKNSELKVELGRYYSVVDSLQTEIRKLTEHNEDLRDLIKERWGNEP